MLVVDRVVLDAIDQLGEMWNFHDEYAVGTKEVIDAPRKVLKVIDMRNDVVRKHRAGPTLRVAYLAGELLGEEFVRCLKSARVGHGRKVRGGLHTQRTNSAGAQRAEQDP